MSDNIGGPIFDFEYRFQTAISASLLLRVCGLHFCDWVSFWAFGNVRFCVFCCA